MTDINTQVNRDALGMALEDLESVHAEVMDGKKNRKWDLAHATYKVLQELYKAHPELRPLASGVR